jgi:hypothetical protein
VIGRDAAGDGAARGAAVDAAPLALGLAWAVGALFADDGPAGG